MTVLFLLVTLFFWIGTAGFAKVWYFSIQEDQWLDSLFGWQKKLEAIGQKSGTLNAILYKAGGGCAFCFGHMVGFVTFWFYAAITFNSGLWPEYDTILTQWVFNVVAYLIYVSTATTINSLVINRL